MIGIKIDGGGDVGSRAEGRTKKMVCPSVSILLSNPTTDTSLNVGEELVLLCSLLSSRVRFSSFASYYQFILSFSLFIPLFVHGRLDEVESRFDWRVLFVDDDWWLVIGMRLVEEVMWVGV